MDWVKILRDEARYNSIIVAEELARRRHIGSASLRTALWRQQNRGLVERVTHGIYVNGLAPGFLPTDLVQVLRPNAYVSLESALYDWGISTQSPSILTCVTAGKPREYRTKSFTIVFRAIAPRLFWGFQEKQARYASYRIAEPEKALLDWVYLSLQNGFTPDLDELDFKPISRPKLLQYAEKYPATVLNLLLRSLATANFAA